MKFITPTICVATLAIIIIFLLLRSTITPQTNSQLQQMTIEAERISGDTFKYTSKSPKGVRIISVEKPSKQMVEAIDKGFGDLFTTARRKPNNYRKSLNYSNYTVYIANPDRLEDINKAYSPDIAIAANQYAGSIYDKGGYIYAAGIVTTFSPSSFMLAIHTKDFNRVSDVVRFEGEHLVLYHNDRKKFLETQDHSKGGGHPILQ